MSAPVPTLADAARTYRSAGLCVLPAMRAEKRPAVGPWKRYRKRMPTEAELSAWFANGPDAVCILCGRASDNLEIIDFDAGGELFDAWSDKVRAAAPGLIEKLVVQTTQSGGRHVVYRCVAAVCGNLKLAQRAGGEKVVTLIETRGEGGLFLCAPTDGYEVIQGDLCDPPVLSDPERDVLLQAAWGLNEYLPPVVDGPKMSPTVGHSGPLSADSSNNPPLSAHKANKPHISAHNADSSPMSANNSNIRPMSADSSENRHGANDSSDNAACSSDNSHNSACASDNAHNPPLSAENSHIRLMSADNSHRCDCLPENSNRPGDDFNRRGDVRAVLEQFGWSLARGGENEYWRRPGKTSGWSATLKGRVFYVFSSNAAPFEPNRAYSPFAVYTLLNHGGDYEQAARSLRELGYGGDSPADNATGADISAIVQACGPQPPDDSDNPHDGPDIADPGPIPEHLFHVPGFVAQVMEFTLANAPYPNLGLAFCGAMALQSYLCGRKVCTPGDLRPNIYLLALASSGTGKDFPRKVNSRVLLEIGHVGALGDKFASGEGIQDALLRSPAMLFQNDEMDGVLRQINLDRENRRESIPNILLTLYTSANDIYPVRVKAGQKETVHIDQPHLTLFGTATPQYFYEALSQRMLTNGFFARLIVVDIGRRGRGQAPGSARHLPEDILRTARWWADFQPGGRGANLQNLHPEPHVVPFEPDAMEAMTTLQRMTEAEYDRAEEMKDEVGRTAWSRTCENAGKLALLYACSENHENPVIGLPAVEWASAFAMHQTRRQLFLAASYVATTEFDGLCKKLVRYLTRCRDSQKGYPVPDWKLRRHLALNPKVHDGVTEALVKQQRIQFVTIPGKTKPRSGWILR